MHKCNHPSIEKEDSMTRTITVDEYCRTFVLGCLSHPQAREYLMAPVIEHLNRYQENQESHDATIRNATLEPLKATYNKFKCLDKILSDVAGKCGEAKTATMLEVAGEMWQAIKESLRKGEHP